MDAHRFDQFVRALSRARSRRGVVALLASLPLVGGLAALVADEESAARDRRKRPHQRRTGKHKSSKKGKRKGKRKKKRCKTESAAQTCAGKCATVNNNCQQPVDCGPCACDPACPACQTCETASGKCGPNGAVDGQACGEPGQVCTQGTCACSVQACLNAGGCCDGSTCVPTDFQTDPAHCGDCQTACAAGETCQGSVCCLPDSADLQAAIGAADPDATLTLCPGAWALTSTVSISQGLTLLGAGAGQTNLDGGDAVQVLFIGAGADVTLEALTITKGSGAFGAGIFNDGTLTLREATVSDNTATSQGGGIYTNGNLTLEDGSRILDNSASVEGGGIRINGGTTTLQAGSRVAGNSAGTQGGG